ncbi:hypothetical protein LWX53_08010 [bacterium]|nr:hypothetical protein [bacterium]
MPRLQRAARPRGASALLRAVLFQVLAMSFAALLLLGGCAALKEAPGSAPPGAGVQAGSAALSAYGAPKPALERYRTGQPDPRALRLGAPAKATASGSAAAEAAVREVSLALASRESDPFMKVKLIHDWICLNISYDAAMLRSGQATGQDLASVWKSRTAVCSGYARFFKAMAESAGLPCAVVSGFAKNQGGRRGLEPENSHAWNVVKIGGASYIVDATFDAGYVEDWRFVPRYSTDNLFVDPGASIFTRYPKEAEYQLLRNPVGAAGFLASPDLESAYFALGLRAPVGLAWKNAAHGRYALDIDAGGPGLILDAAVFGPSGIEIPQAAMLQRRSPEGWTLLLAMRDIGVHRVECYAARAGDSSGRLNKVMTFLADNDAVADIGGFPRFYARYQRSVRRGEKASFAYRAPGAPAAMLIAAGRQFPMEKGSDGVFRLSLVPPAGADEVKLALSEGGDAYGVAVAWSTY